MRERGAREEDVREAIRIGHREPAQRGLYLYRLNLTTWKVNNYVGSRT